MLSGGWFDSFDPNEGTLRAREMADPNYNECLVRKDVGFSSETAPTNEAFQTVLRLVGDHDRDSPPEWVLAAHASTSPFRPYHKDNALTVADHTYMTPDGDSVDVDCGGYREEFTRIVDGFEKLHVDRWPRCFWGYVSQLGEFAKTNWEEDLGPAVERYFSFVSTALAESDPDTLTSHPTSSALDIFASPSLPENDFETAMNMLGRESGDNVMVRILLGAWHVNTARFIEATLATADEDTYLSTQQGAVFDNLGKAREEIELVLGRPLPPPSAEDVADILGAIPKDLPEARQELVYKLLGRLYDDPYFRALPWGDERVAQRSEPAQPDIPQLGYTISPMLDITPRPERNSWGGTKQF